MVERATSDRSSRRLVTTSLDLRSRPVVALGVIVVAANALALAGGPLLLALAGALIALLDRSALDSMETLREKIEVIELNLQPGFEDRYIDHLALP